MIFVARNLSPQKLSNQLAATTPYPTISIASSDTQTRESITPSASRNIEVISPLIGDSVKSGFVIKGNARTFENSVVIRLVDSNGNNITEVYTSANASDVGQFGPFEKAIDFTSDQTEGTLEVFQYSAKDGIEIDKVIIPLQFSN